MVQFVGQQEKNTVTAITKPNSLPWGNGLTWRNSSKWASSTKT